MQWLASTSMEEIMSVSRQQALDYHNGSRPGKIEVTPTKPCRTQRDLSLAYTPGVAVPCLEIQKNPQDAFKYTGRGNLIAVLSNGTAVPGLGDIGALASKPVMEGKAVLFKRFADVDVFDLEVNSHDPGTDHPTLPTAQAHIRWYQPRRHQSPRLLSDRRGSSQDHEDSCIPRRPARHCDHLRSGLAQCSRSSWEGHSHGPCRLQRCWSCRHRLRRALCTPRSKARKHHPLRHQGSRLPGPQGWHEQIQRTLRTGYEAAHAIR